MIVKPIGAQCRLKGNLLEYPVTVVGVLGLWSLIAGGTLGGAGQGHTQSHKHTPQKHQGRRQRRELKRDRAEQEEKEAGRKTRR